MAGEREAGATGAAETTAAPVVSAQLRRRLQQCFEHASKLMQSEKYDFDYANTLLTECVQQDPGNLVYVEKFLDNLQQKYAQNKRGARFAGFGGRGPFKKAVAARQSIDVLRAGAELLKTNPWDVATLRPMAEACAALDFREVELRYLKNALDADPKDAEVNRHCAKSLQRMGQFDQAIVCWHRVEEALRNDEEAPRMVAQLQIEKTRAKAGFGDPAGARSKPPAASPGASPSPAASAPPSRSSPADEPASASPTRRELHLTPRQRLERAVAEDPGALDSLLQLAQLHLDEQRVADAETLLKRALAIAGHDWKVRERFEDVSILRHRQQLAVAERLAAAEKTRESQELVLQLRQELNRFELEVYRGRCDRYPRETAYRYQLGLRLKRAGNFAEAVVQLTPLAEGESPQAIPASFELGECHQMLKQFPPALEWYRRTAERAVGGEHPEVRKLALYRGGVLAAAMRDFNSAETLLSRLVALDEGYKDSADRLDKLRRMRHKEGP